jgi:hypothetical protein
MESAFSALFESFPDYELTGTTILAADNLAVAEAMATGTHSAAWDSGQLGVLPATEASVAVPQLGVLDFEGDMIVRYRVYQDLMVPMIQLGAVPAPEMPPLIPSIEVPDPAPPGLSPVEAIERNADLWNGASMPDYIASYRDDADLSLPGFPPSLTRAEYAASQEGFWMAFPDRHMNVTRAVDLGDGWVLAEAVWQGTNTGPYFGAAASNETVELRGAILGRVDEEGLITYFHVYFDNLTLLDQMGRLALPR